MLDAARRKGNDMKMMPTSTITPSQLTPGRHPGYLGTITEEPTPPDWAMAKSSPTMYKWWLLIWETPELIGHQDPEVQSGITSTKLTPKGRFQASSAYTWSCQLLQCAQLPVAGVDWDAHVPLPCRVKVGRIAGKDYIRVEDLEAWPEGAQYLPLLQAQLQQLRVEREAAAAVAMAQRATMAPDPAVSAPAPEASAPAPAPQVPTPQPGMQTWGTTPPAPTTPPGPPRW
jgi:hypothetical protein